MVKQRKGSRAGKTKLTKSAKKAAKRAGKPRRIAIPNGAIRDQWNVRLTSSQNLSRMGLTASVNSFRSIPSLQVSGCSSMKTSLEHEKDTSKAAPVDVVSRLELEASKPERRRKQRISPGEERFLSEMTSAFGDDYEAMARDIKRNYLQWTPNQLRRKFESRNRVKAESA